MPTNAKHFAHVMTAVAKRMRAEFEASEVIRHHGTKGSWREKTVRDFLRSYLPGHIRISHGGEIVSASGQVSNECDIALFDRSVPPFLGGEDGALLPIECVYGVVEVKTNLRKKELIDACEKIRYIKSIPKTEYRSYGRPKYEAYGRTYDYFPTVGMIFAFGGPSLESTAANLRSWIADKPPEELPDSVWVLGKGYFAWWNNQLNSVDLTPSLESKLAFFRADPNIDILLPFALNLNIMFGQANMAPLLLTAYSGDTPLADGAPQVWTD